MDSDTPLINFPISRIGIAADHGGFALKQFLVQKLLGAGTPARDFGDQILLSGDDYPDFVAPLARAVAKGDIERGIAICGSGVGACIAANKVRGVRACLIHDLFSARQGVEDDHLNIMTLGGFIVGESFAWDLVQIFLAARFSNAERHCRRVAKVMALEAQPAQPLPCR